MTATRIAPSQTGRRTGGPPSSCGWSQLSGPQCVIFTFAGVGIGLVVMFIADRMQQSSARATLKPA